MNLHDKTKVMDFDPDVFHNICFSKERGNYCNNFSAANTAAFMQYIDQRQWVNRSLQFSHEGCLEEDKSTWTEGYYHFLEEISVVFKVTCSRKKITEELLLLPVPYRDAIIRSLPVIIACDAFPVIDYFRQRYNTDLLLPNTTDEKELRVYYRPFLHFPPRRVVDYFLTETNINHADLFHLAIRSADYLLLKRIVRRVNDISQSVFHRLPLEVDFRMAERADVEDSCLISFFDFFVEKFGRDFDPTLSTWDNIVKSVISAGNENLLLHILSRQDCILSFDIILFCIETHSVTAWNIGKILDIRRIDLTNQYVDMLLKKGGGYCFEFYLSISDRNRRIVEEITGGKFVQSFPEVLLNEAIINLRHMAFLGMKGLVSIEKATLHSAAVRDAFEEERMDLLPDTSYGGDADPRKKYNEYFVIEEFADQPNNLYVKTLYSLLHDPRSPYHNSYVVKRRLESCDLTTADMKYLEQWFQSSSPNSEMKSLEKAFSAVSIDKKPKGRAMGWVPKEQKKREPRSTSSSVSDYEVKRGPNRSNKNKKRS